MYPHFIELHTADDNEPVCINIDRIAMIYPNPDKEETGSFVSFAESGSYQNVTESYEELKDLIRSSGCAIQKADPRLDGTIPLTMDDLCRLEMIGEPVWNSNTRHWMLVIDSDTMHKTVDLVDNCGKVIRYDPHDVSKYPLYRMRKTE